MKVRLSAADFLRFSGAMRLSSADFVRLNVATVPRTAKLRFLRKKGIRASIAELILDRMPRRHEDLLTMRKLVVEESGPLRRLIQASPLNDLHAPRATLSTSTQKMLKGGLISEVRVLRGDGDEELMEIALRDATGEIAAIRLTKDSSFEWQSLHFLGIRVPYLWTLTPDQKALLHTRLHAIQRASLTSVGQGAAEWDDDLIDRRIKGLSFLVIALQNFTASAADQQLYASGVDPFAATRNPSPGISVDGDPDDIDLTDNERERDCTEYNACGPEFSAEIARLIPEFTFAECCNAHDIAYCEGCSECDRAKADSDFLQCMLRSSPNNHELAFIYYLAVRAIGVIPFSHCFDRHGITGLVTGIVGIAAGVGVSLSVITLGLPTAIGAGAAVGALVTWVTSRLLCLPCELIDDRLESLIKQVKEFAYRIRQELRRSRAACRRKRGFLARLKCRIKSVILLFILWVLVVIAYVLVTIVSNIIRTLLCGGLSRN